jgi:hypothetical protein
MVVSWLEGARRVEAASDRRGIAGKRLGSRNDIETSEVGSHFHGRPTKSVLSRARRKAADCSKITAHKNVRTLCWTAHALSQQISVPPK